MDGVTQYGFTWGPMQVTRVTKFKRGRVLALSTDYRQVEIFVSPKGKRVRVFIDGQEVTA